MFVKPSSGWVSTTETNKLTASDGAAGDEFGSSASIGGNTVVVGGRKAYLFVPPTSGWPISMTETCEFSAGSIVAIDGNSLVVGAPHTTVNGNVNQGAAYIFGPLALTPSTLPVGTENAPYNQTITAQTISALGGTSTVNLTVSNIQGAIPGLTPGVDFLTSGTGSLAVSGTPTATGTETFTVTATDSPE